jgi:hypothetical protein
MVSPGKIIFNRKGTALIAVYMVVAVLLAFGGYVIDVSNSQNNTANTFKRQTQAISIAEAGLDRALVWLRLQGTPPQGSISSISQNLPPTGTPLGSYTVAFTDLGSPGGSTIIRRYRVRSTGTIGTASQVVTTYFQPDNYARYIWFTDSESYQGTNVWFWDQDRLNGPTHTNGHFNIKGNPIFEGEVRSVDDYLRYYNDGNNINSSNLSNPPHDLPDFQDVVTLGADAIKMPTQALNLRTASTNGGIRYTGDTTIHLNSNGTMNATNGGHTYNNIALPANGALFVNNGNLNISGTLSGRLTAGASGDINVTDNITYAHDPRVSGSTSTDTLGLISEGDVMIDSNASHANLEIDASIMALNTSFLLEDWWTDGARGTLTVFGGIIQKQRGPVGTFSGDTKVSGYSKNYKYDVRLLSSPPPFVPTTGDYIPLSWEN